MSIDDHIRQLLEGEAFRQKSFSGLGFFSKPVRISVEEEDDFVVKVYRAVKEQTRGIDLLIQHDDYVARLQEMGLRVPETEMKLIPTDKVWVPVIVQAAFADRDLLRNRMIEASEAEYLHYLKAMMLEVKKYQRYVEQDSAPIGFHPTSRNYAWQNGTLWFFDSFPPMSMDQQSLNRLILDFAPVKLPLGGLIPTSVVNRVSDEYYQLDKMILGIVGSACRLRPEYVDAVLAWAQDYAQSSLDGPLQEAVLAGTSAAPKLSSLWTNLRKILGKEGKPNVE